MHLTCFSTMKLLEKHLRNTTPSALDFRQKSSTKSHTQHQDIKTDRQTETETETETDRDGDGDGDGDGDRRTDGRTDRQRQFGSQARRQTDKQTDRANRSWDTIRTGLLRLAGPMASRIATQPFPPAEGQLDRCNTCDRQAARALLASRCAEHL